MALNTAITGTTSVLGVRAHGVYDAATNIVTARRVQVRLTE